MARGEEKFIARFLPFGKKRDKKRRRVSPKTYAPSLFHFLYTLNLPVAACSSVARSASEWDADAISWLDADCSCAAAEIVCVS